MLSLPPHIFDKKEEIASLGYAGDKKGYVLGKQSTRDEKENRVHEILMCALSLDMTVAPFISIFF